MNKKLSILLVLLAVVMSLSVGALGTQATGDYDWEHVAETPSGARQRNTLAGVSFSSRNFGHSVGFYRDPNASGLYRTITTRWDGTSWVRTTSANPNLNADNLLYGVVTLSPTDAWAVGKVSNSGGGEAGQVMIQRYDAATDTWNNYPVTVPGASESALIGIAAAASNDIWAVGYYRPTDATTQQPLRTLTLHWDGIAWSPPILPSQNVGTDDNKLFGVTSVPGSPYLFWAVGASGAAGANSTLVLKYDARMTGPGGPTWTVVPSDNVKSVSNCLRGVTAVDEVSAWTAGYAGSDCFQDSPETSPVAPESQTVILKWDAGFSRWNIVTTPNPDTRENGENKLLSISASAPDKVWAVGYYGSPADDLGHEAGYKTMVLHRHGDGQIETWIQHCSENPSERFWDRLVGVDAIDSEDAWAVGWYYPKEDHPYLKPTLALRYSQPDCHATEP